MIVRALDADGDWLFGKGKNDYKSQLDAVAQSVSTRVKSFLGDCFFAMDQGIDWFNLLGTKQVVQLALSVSSTVLNTENVDSILDFQSSLSEDRDLTLSYKVKAFFGTINAVVNTSDVEFLLTQSGDILATQDGSFLEP